MLTKIIDNNSISCIPEDSDDLIILRRIIKKGDIIVGETTRVIKQEKDFARPDKGERIKIRLSLDVEKISLDDVLDRIRVGGMIKESNNESIPHGSHHSFIIKVDQPFNLIKKKSKQTKKTISTKEAEQIIEEHHKSHHHLEDKETEKPKKIITTLKIEPILK